jgi:HTH-type transcriptional regulator/antitoxin HigA
MKANAIAQAANDGNQLTPAYTPPPGEILRMELAARGWTQRQFAAVIGKPAQAISEIMHARKQLTPETALRIASALGTSPQLWTGLEADYRLSLARRKLPASEIRAIEERSQRLASF